MKRFLGWSLFFVLLLGFVVLPWLILDDSPAIEPPGELRRTDLAWVKALLHKHDPRLQPAGVIHSIRLDEDELNRLLNYAVELRRVSGVAAELTPGTATLIATLTVPANPFGRYINVTADVAEARAGVRIDSVRLGDLPVPGVLADALAHVVHRRLRRDETYAALADAFSRVSIDENQATLDYRWRPELLTRLERKSVELLVPETDRARMLAYAERLDALLTAYPRGTTVPLVDVVAPLFADTRTRSGVSEENRAALTALAAYLSGISLQQLLEGDTDSLRRAPRVLLSLHGRRDFAEHFIISAALTVNAGSRMANAIGLVKEEEDASGGSGFSFTDLAANRAGVQLAERATGRNAKRVQQRLAAARSDDDLLPDFRDLPEFMSQPEFERGYGPVGGPRYQRMIDRIDARLATHPLLK
jgi:hypothetical protein